LLPAVQKVPDGRFYFSGAEGLKGELYGGKNFDHGDTGALESGFHFGGAKAAGVELHHKFLAGRCDLNALNAVDGIGVSNLLHQGFVKRTLQAEVLLNFGHCEERRL
jgi:hypothetical protein